MKRGAALVLCAYALLAVLVIPVFPHFVSPNEFTRWATAVALVDYHTFEVIRLAPLLGRDFEDISVVDGHYYSNKAPGGAIVGLPAYAIARLFCGPPTASNMRWTLTAMRLLAATIPALLLALLFVRAAAALGAPRAVFAMVALLFGTPLFAYGMQNFSHALTAMALFAAWVLLFVRPSPAGDYAAGALIGLAVVSEYPAAIPAAVLVACAIGSRNLVRIIGGGAPFAIAIALYNRALFGSAFALSSGFEREAAFRQLARHGVFGVGLPDPMIMLRLLFDPSKGLFVFSPVLIVGIFAIPAVRRALAPRPFWSLVLTPVAIFLTYAGYPNWHGGWTVGARYLVPALPFVAFLVAFLPASLDRIASLLLGASVAAVTVTSLVFPFVPPEFPAPWGSTFTWPILRDGFVAPNLLHFVARPLAIAVPFAVVIGVVAAVVPRRALVAAGAVAVLAIGLAMPVAPNVAVLRGFIEEVTFDRDGAIEQAAPPGMRVSPALIQRAHNARRQSPTSWPF